MGLRHYWRAIKPATSGADVSAPALQEATHDALRLKYLDGGHGEGCHNDDEGHTLARRRFHHLTFYGFLLCLASTATGTLYHYLLDWPAPYDWPSVPKLLGGIGGLSLLVGTVGLWRLNLKRHPLHAVPEQRGMDRGFIALLALITLSGLLLWGLRSTAAMPMMMRLQTSAALPLMLCLHLGAVMALFATLPYSKFAHGFYRTASLLRHAVEKRQPNQFQTEAS